MFDLKMAGRGVLSTALAGFLAVSAVVCLPAQPANAAGLTGSGPIRMGGADRYSTSQAIVKSNFPSSTKAVFLATGATFPDALAAGPAAGLLDSPVVLTASGGLSAPAAQELGRLRPGTIYVMGGTGAVSNTVFNAAKAYSANVVRISGTDRYSTAVGTSKRFWPSASTVYVASGTGFADALSGGALAAKTGSPVVLTSPYGLVASTRAELQRLAPSKVVLLGGTGALSGSVYSQIQSALPGTSVTRLQGADRAATSAAIAKAGWGSSAKAMYASGANFPDALAGVAAAAANDAPLLLTNGGCMPPSVWNESNRLGVTTKGILGGQGVLTITSVSASCGEAAPFPAPSASARSYSGYGDSVINISKPDGAASIGMATLTHRGDSYFSVWGYDSSGDETDLLASEIGDYAGTVAFDAFSWSGSTVKMAVTAEGPWTISIASVKSAPRYGKQSINGHRDAVFSYSAGQGTADIYHDGSGYFSLWVHSLDRQDSALVANRVGKFSGSYIWPAGPAVVAVTADGFWKASIR